MEKLCHWDKKKLRKTGSKLSTWILWSLGWWIFQSRVCHFKPNLFFNFCANCKLNYTSWLCHEEIPTEALIYPIFSVARARPSSPDNWRGWHGILGNFWANNQSLNFADFVVRGHWKLGVRKNICLDKGSLTLKQHLWSIGNTNLLLIAKMCGVKL